MTKESKSRALHPHCHCAPQAQQSRKAARFTFTGLIHFVRNDKGEKEPGTASPLSLRATSVAQQSRKAARFTFTGLIHFVRNDKGEKEPGTAFPLSLRAAGAAIQESGKVHIYWIDSLRSQ